MSAPAAWGIGVLTGICVGMFIADGCIWQALAMNTISGMTCAYIDHKIKTK